MSKTRFESGYELRRVVFAVEKLKIAKEEENKRHEVELARIDLELKSIQGSCPHPLTDFIPDPSGNNDSDDVCQICDAHGVR